jgi:hypothetical protein
MSFAGALFHYFLETIMSVCRVAMAVSTLFLSFSIAAVASGPTPPTQAAGYSLVFYDDFLNFNLSPDGTGQYTWYPGEYGVKPPSPFRATVASSVLDLNWTRGQSPANTSISSCSTDGTHCTTFRYGYFEARMKWDVTPGAWPTFMLSPVQSIWGATENGELDIFEGAASSWDYQTFYGTIHDWVTENGTPIDVANNGASNGHKIAGVDFSQWHTYGVLWAPGKVTWYFDQQPVLSASTYAIFDKQDYYLILTSQVGSTTWVAGSTSGVTANAINLYVDWVKVWQNN